MRVLRNVTIAGAILGIVSFALAHAHPFGDAGLYAQRHGPPRIGPPQAGLPQIGLPQILEHAAVPPAVRDVLTAKCADCHSAQTHAPLYGRFAPASWLMERDIVAAREAMNLSLWERYSADQQETLKAEMLMQAKAHAMPPIQYRLVHVKATMTDTDIAALTDWARGPARVSDSGTPALTEGDALRGREVFEKRCTGCHAMDEDREGPRLRGVVGRSSGGVPGFDYSPALAKAHIVWNETTLEQWLADPDALVPGNNMEFHVAKPQERQDLIRFLRGSAGK